MKKSIFYLLAVLLLMSFKGAAYSAEKVTVAVLDLTAKGVPIIVANAVTDIIRSEFVNIANFTVVERAQMKAVLEEQGLQMTGCTDSACAVQFGKILSARRIVVGEVNKMGNAIVITARYVDVQSGEALFSATDKAATMDDLDSAAKRISKDLATRIVTGDKEVIVPKTAKGYYYRSIVPGWGQFYAGNPIRGYTFSILFGLSCAASGYLGYDFYTKKSDYDGLKKGTSRSDFKTARGDYETAAKYLNYSFMLLGAVYVIHWVDAYFFSRSDFDQLFAGEIREGSYFTCQSNYVPASGDIVFNAGYGMRF